MPPKETSPYDIGKKSLFDNKSSKKTKEPVKYSIKLLYAICKTPPSSPCRCDDTATVTNRIAYRATNRPTARLSLIFLKKPKYNAQTSIRQPVTNKAVLPPERNVLSNKFTIINTFIFLGKICLKRLTAKIISVI